MRKTLLLLLSLATITAFAQSSHNASLSWTPSSDAASNPTLNYNVYRATGACPASGSPAALAKVGSVTATAFSDSNVSVGQSYCYIVRAALNGSESADSNTAGGTVPISPVGGLTVTVK